MILVLNVCRERLHYFEFVKPVEDVLRLGGFEFETFGCLEDVDYSKYDKVVICGTSLKDSDYLGRIERFDWSKDFEGDVLGICAGFQILGKVFGCEVRKGGVEIGFFREKFDKEFLGAKGNLEVYHLHSNYVEFTEDWEVFAKKDFAQAVRRNNFYGVLFHPEVRNKDIILNWAKV